MPRPMSYDRVLFVTVGLLLLGGLIMVASTSYYPARRYGVGQHYFLLRHCLWACLGLVAMLGLMNVPYRKLADGRVVAVAVVAILVALVVVLAMPPVKGAHRWLPLAGFSVQPSEFAKLVAILFTAYVLARKEPQVNEPWAVPIPLAIVLGPMAFLILVEPDLGATVMLAATVGTMVFLAGLRWRYVVAAATAAVAITAVAILSDGYRLARIRSFLEARDDLTSIAYQLRQSLVALGSGGLFGVGLTDGQQKKFFLPDAHTDFVYAVIGEEFGLVGTLLVLTAFVVLFWRGIRAALGAPDRFGFYLASGITTLVVLQGLVNMGVCVGLFPTKGLALPFLSYGGSSLVATLAATGVLLNVSQHSN